MTDVGFLDTRRQEHVENDDDGKEVEIRSRQGDETQIPGNGCKGQCRQDSNTGAGERRQRSRRMALQEGDLRRADHVDDQCLGPHGFDEPAALEHRGEQGDLRGIG